MPLRPAPRTLSLLALAAILSTTTAASALGLEYGLRAGTGTAFWADTPNEPDSTHVLTIGPAARLGLSLVTLEAGLLWNRASWEQGGVESSVSRLALPIMAKVNLPLVPGFLSLGVGAGLEPRWLLSSDVGGVEADKSFAEQTLHVPVAAGIDLDLQVVKANLELRYAHALDPEFAQGEARRHELMLMAGLFF